ncbi:hypothetical protein AK88_03801 [Plasmodium fragile]|uniref:Uncharacterized protein n=1 Tax=Plasmodium fragile TaxID=5857 RepID=A0A0D9QHS4_PLAFR|nr:uncharacterized protein AK88_03801 [Plasmodium fragile]KJP86605.1 hypothetical protein AK88_03801 [Plasmodium fragile]
MKKFDKNYSGFVEFNIRCKHIVKRFFIEALATFKKCHISPKSAGFLRFTKIFNITVLLWILYYFSSRNLLPAPFNLYSYTLFDFVFQYFQSIATVEIWGTKENDSSEWLILRSSRLLSNDEIVSNENHGYSRKNIADLLELDEKSIEEQYESLISEGFNQNSIKWKIFGKHTPRVVRIANQINKTIDMELIRALKSDSCYEGIEVISLKESKNGRIKSFFRKYKIFVPHVLLFLGAIVAASLKEPFSAVLLVILLFILIIFFFVKIRKCTYIMEMNRKSRNRYIGLDY